MSHRSSQTIWPPLRSSALSTPPYVTCQIRCQPHYPLASPPKPHRPNQSVQLLHAPPHLHPEKIPHPDLRISPPHPTTSTPQCTAPTTTPDLAKCSATLNCMPRRSPTLGKRNSFAPANMTCRNLPRPPNTRTTNLPTSPFTPRLPAPADPPGGKKEERQLRPRSLTLWASLQKPRPPSPSPPAVSLPSENHVHPTP